MQWCAIKALPIQYVVHGHPGTMTHHCHRHF